jgi:hypothetical protein
MQQYYENLSKWVMLIFFINTFYSAQIVDMVQMAEGVVFLVFFGLIILFFGGNDVTY